MQAHQPSPFSIVNHEPAPEADPTPVPTPPTKRPSRRKRSSSMKALPTDRLTLDRQMAALHGFALASESEGRAVTIHDVAKLIHLSASSVSLTTNFFVDSGLLVRAEATGFRPTSITEEYRQAREWDPENAAKRLAPAVEKAWFTRVLTKQISANNGTISIEDAVSLLGQEANATPASYYNGHIRTLLEFLGVVGLVRSEGNTLRLNQKDGKPMNSVATSNGATENAPPFKPASPPPSSEHNQSGTVVLTSDEVHELASMPAEALAIYFRGLARGLMSKKEGG